MLLECYFIEQNIQTWLELEQHRAYMYIQLRKMNVTPLLFIGVKWPFSKDRGRSSKNAVTPLNSLDFYQH